MLSEDDGTEQIAKKKRKLGPENAKATQLLTKWGLQLDPVCRHVLLNLNMQELKGVGGGPLDQISAFKFRHKLGVEEDRKL